MTDTKKPEPLRLADALQQQAVWEGHYGPSYLRDLLPQAAAELRRLHEKLELQKALVAEAQAMAAKVCAENEALRKAYWKMRNAAAGYSNYCEESASTRRCEREYTEAEEMFRAAMKGQP